jgi:FKBP-type peptidyl-prolyl cis-trans isomerase
MRKLSLLLASALMGSMACNQKAAEPPASSTPPSTPSGSQTQPPTPAQPPPDPAAPPDVKAPPADAEKTATGLASKVLKPGTGKVKPTLADIAKVHYTGWTTDGRKFDSSVGGDPAQFPLNEVIKGWGEGLQLMVEGEKRRFWIPASLAYGDTPQHGAPAGMLVFDVEMLGITKAPPPPVAPTVPADVAAPPRNAKKTKSGLAYRVLQKGTGKQHPTADNVVEVHYSGWTTDGKMFDSSVMRGSTATFPLGRVIPGWTEGLQLMAVGEKTRFWIPAALAYGENAAQMGKPAGMLVFDVELVAIKPAMPSPH